MIGLYSDSPKYQAEKEKTWAQNSSSVFMLLDCLWAIWLTSLVLSLLSCKMSVGSRLSLRLLLNLKSLLFFHFKYQASQTYLRNVYSFQGASLTFSYILIIWHYIFLQYMIVTWDVEQSWWERPIHEYLAPAFCQRCIIAFDQFYLKKLSPLFKENHYNREKTTQLVGA